MEKDNEEKAPNSKHLQKIVHGYLQDEWSLDKYSKGSPLNLIHCLWLKETGRHSQLFPIPDTLFFRCFLLQGWYFTSKTGSVLRKSSAKLSSFDHILADFIKLPVKRNQVVAYAVQLDSIQPITFLTTPDLRKLFHGAKSTETVLVQRLPFMEIEDFTLIRGTFSSGGCYLEARTLDNKNKNFTYAPHYVLKAFQNEATRSSYTEQHLKFKEYWVSSQVLRRIKQIHSAISKKLKRILGDNIFIKKMVCFFLMGTHNNLTFLWCSECDIKNELHVSKKTCEDVLSEYARKREAKNRKFQTKKKQTQMSTFDKYEFLAKDSVSSLENRQRHDYEEEKNNDQMVKVEYKAGVDKGKHQNATSARETASKKIRNRTDKATIKYSIGSSLAVESQMENLSRKLTDVSFLRDY